MSGNMVISPVRIKEIIIYPIKSLPGIRVSEAVVTTKGLLGYPTSLGLRDRGFMIVDKNGTFLTLRTHADIFTCIKVALEESYLVLSAPECTDLRIPLAQEEESPWMDVRVWSWEGRARVVSEEASAWISEILGKPCHIVRCDERDHDRPVDGNWVTERTQATAQATFADGFPYLFVFEESFKDLQTDLHNIEFTIDRFRGNIVVSGGRKWQEDTSCTLVVEDSLEFDLVKPCTRCKVPTIHPETGSVDSIVHDVLARRRSGLVLGWHEPKSFKHSTFFGVNAVFHKDMSNDRSHITKDPCISIGDIVTLNS